MLRKTISTILAVIILITVMPVSMPAVLAATEPSVTIYGDSKVNKSLNIIWNAGDNGGGFSQCTWYMGDTGDITSTSNLTAISSIGTLSMSFTLTEKQVGKYIYVNAKGANSNYVLSTGYGPVSAPALLTGVSILGKSEVFSELAAITTFEADITPNESVTYKWQIADTADGNYSDIISETKYTYTTSDDDLGKFIRVVVTGGVSKVAKTSVPIAIKTQEAAKGAVSATFQNSINEITLTVADVTKVSEAYIYIGEVKSDAVKSYSVYEITLDMNGKASIDVSAYAKKGVTLRIHNGDASVFTDVELVKNDAKLKVALSKLEETNATARLSITNNGTAITDFTKMQFRVEGGAWQLYTDANLEAVIAKVEQFGATLYFRMLGNDIDDDTNDLMFASTEAKLKYPKLGKQPSVVVDYLKGTVKFPKGVEVIGVISGSNGTTVATDWEVLAAVKDKAGTINITDLLTKTAGEISFDFLVRTAALLKKPNSSITGVNIVEKATALTASSIDITGIYDTKATALLKNIKIENKTTQAIEYTVTESTVTEPAADAKWTKLAASTGFKNLSAADNGKAIWIRVSAAKAVTAKGTAPVRMSDAFKVVISVAPNNLAPETPAGTEVTFITRAIDATGGDSNITKIIEITFNSPITGLTADDITISDYTTTATKGELNGEGTNYELSVTSVGVAASGKVKINIKDFGSFVVTSKDVEVTIRGVNMRELIRAITDGVILMYSIATSINGADVATTNKWATQENISTFQATMNAGDVIYAKTTATQSEVAAAVAALAEATIAFKATIAFGTQSE